MIIRDCTDSDFNRLRAIHGAQGIEYALDLTSPLLDIKLVAEDDRGVVQQAILARVTSECYLLMDKDAGSPQDRWQMFQCLHASALRRGWERGYADTHIWVPPELDKPFGRRLMRLGWTRPLWPCYTRVLGSV